MPLAGDSQACSGLTRLGRLARRRIDGHPPAALQGHDALHQVLVVPRADSPGTVEVTVEGSSPVVRAVAPTILTVLDGLARTTVFSGQATELT